MVFAPRNDIITINFEIEYLKLFQLDVILQGTE